MKRYLIAGNWKMNTDVPGARRLAEEIVTEIGGFSNNITILVCPPFTNLSETESILAGSNIKLGAQNCHWMESGACTGEISCRMIKSVGCEYVIIGHSERRQFFGESDETVNLKLKSILAASLIPIVCIGETLSERNTGKTFEILTRQINNGLMDIEVSDAAKIVIAYEPVWAIGTGIAATTEQVDEAHNSLRDLLSKLFGEAGNEILLLYGGSVNENNAREILSLKNVNGALIGGASLKSKSFLSICNEAISLI